MPPKKEKKKPPKVDLVAAAGKAGPQALVRKIPPPPACFKFEEVMKFKELYRQFDPDRIDKIRITQIPLMLRTLGFNPKGAEVEELCRRFLEDEFVDMFEVHEWYQMIEAKKNMGDEIEHEVIKAIGFIGHDDELKPKEIVRMETLQEELMNWGEPLTEAEWVDFPKVALKEKVYTVETDELYYAKLVDKLNARDVKFTPEGVNFFKLDQKQLAAMAREKQAEERAELRRKAAEKAAREEARRQRMIEIGLLQVSDPAKLKPITDNYVEPMDAFEILRLGI